MIMSEPNICSVVNGSSITPINAPDELEELVELEELLELDELELDELLELELDEELLLEDELLPLPP